MPTKRRTDLSAIEDSILTRGAGELIDVDLLSVTLVLCFIYNCGHRRF